MKRVQELVRKLEGHRGGIVDQLRAFLTESLGRPAADEADLQATGWPCRPNCRASRHCARRSMTSRG